MPVFSLCLLLNVTECKRTVIKELKYNKPKEPSSIPSKFLKLFETALSNPTSSLTIKFPFSSGTFPKILKIANVIPIFKEDMAPFATTIAQFHYFPI